MREWLDRCCLRLRIVVCRGLVDRLRWSLASNNTVDLQRCPGGWGRKRMARIDEKLTDEMAIDGKPAIDEKQESKGDLAIRVSMLPRDTNPGGTIFGGVILSHLDIAGAIEARRHADKSFVTVAMTGVEFISPVYVGDVVSFYTRTVRIGRTSVTVAIVVEAVRYHDSNQVVRVMEAEAVYVAVDENRRPVQVREQSADDAAR